MAGDWGREGAAGLLARAGGALARLRGAAVSWKELRREAGLERWSDARDCAEFLEGASVALGVRRYGKGTGLPQQSSPVRFFFRDPAYAGAFGAGEVPPGAAVEGAVAECLARAAPGPRGCVTYWDGGGGGGADLVLRARQGAGRPVSAWRTAAGAAACRTDSWARRGQSGARSYRRMRWGSGPAARWSRRPCSSRWPEGRPAGGRVRTEGGGHRQGGTAGAGSCRIARNLPPRSGGCAGPRGPARRGRGANRIRAPAAAGRRARGDPATLPDEGGFEAGSGSVLGGFEAGSGSVLGGFEAGSGSVLGGFEAGSGSVLGGFEAGFWIGFRRLRGRFWIGFRRLRGRFWIGFRRLRGRFWIGFRRLRGRF